MTVLNILSDRHTIPTLLFLEEAGSSRRTDIYRNVSRSGRMSDKILMMADVGLIVEESGFFSLTGLGRSVVDRLHDIENISDQ